jgi:hypothetical protein
MTPALRGALAFVGGLAAAFVVIAIVEWIGGRVYPLPPGVDAGDMMALRAALSSLPTGALLIVAVGWALGSLVAGLVIGRYSPVSPDERALGAGSLLMLMGLYNLLTLPHPAWFWPVGLAAFVPCAYLGGRIGRTLVPPQKAATDIRPTTDRW